ncbi:MAG: molecular chaperone HtpG, partial [Oxalobacter sp.]
RVDEWMLSFLTEYKEKNLVSVSQGSFDLLKLADEEEKKQNEENQSDYKETIEKMKKVLEGKAKDVRTTVRLTDSPCCLVADEKDMSSNLQRMLKAAGQAVRATQPILEINPTHPLVQRLKYETEQFDDWTNLLFGQAVLAEGGVLADPAEYVRLMNKLLLDK